ncbi:hypothetical protein QTP86_009570 [Hemibagrus guttatus]|nr:hypothetical protein QTP86_009570 [Hemibagrus guttatus]
MNRGVKAGCSRCAGRGRQVEVTGSAELCVPPDRAAVSVSVCNSKESAKDAANSVQRRLDYILHTGRQYGLRNYSIPLYRLSNLSLGHGESVPISGSQYQGDGVPTHRRAHTHIHSGQFRDSSQPRSMSLDCGRKPTKHRENMQTPHPVSGSETRMPEV